MEHIGKFVLYLILAVNALFVGMLILSAYSPYLQPKIHPIASCLGLAFPIFLAVNICFTLFWVIISYRYALLPVIGFLVCIPQIRTYIPINSTVETIPDGSIKFLSYNVMGFNNLEKKEGKNPILSYLADSEADRRRHQKSIESISLPFHSQSGKRRQSVGLFLQIPHTFGTSHQV